jgi:hypothetical protein
MNEIVAANSLMAVSIAIVILVILAIVCLRIKNWTPGLLKLLFILILLPVVITTGYLAYSTIHLNETSSSKGPVHWHADFEIWNCGQEVQLQKPSGFANKIGTATLHEHGDKRIHQEGVVYTSQDASLGNFFKVIGGEITSDFVVIPTNQGKISLVSGQICNGQPAKLQVFVYQVEGINYSQKKIFNPADYVISPFSAIPNGDCIIVEFDSPKDKTDKLCRSYKVAKQIGKLGEEQP